MATLDALLSAARTAQRSLARSSADQRTAALESVARSLDAHRDAILAANADDLRLAPTDLSAAMRDRLALTHSRLDGVITAVHEIAAMPDPLDEERSVGTRPNGLLISRRRIPLGVIAVIYEARPNVTVDAFGLTLKSGNAVLLRGSSSAAESNAALVTVLRDALRDEGLPPDAVQLLPSADRSSVTHLIQARGLVDVVIPRGGAGLIDAVVRDATVPTIETGVGNCHVYVHADADLDVAERIVLNAKTRRTSVCNAAETLLIDSAIAETAGPRLVAALQQAGVTVHDNPTEEQLGAEFLSMEIALAFVDGLDGAIEHINTYGTGHTEAIVTTDLAAAQRFTERVDAAAVMVNASTAFTDGEQFGFGAEIGISTQKLHARGPMGLPELTSTKWIVIGDGHTRPA